MAIGKKLRKLRQSLGLTQEEMSSDMMDRSFYSRIESERSSITTEQLMKILKKQNVSIIKFLNQNHGHRTNNNIFQDQAVEAYFNNDLQQLQLLSENPEINDARAKLAVDFLIAKLEGRTNEITPIVRKKMKYIFFQVGEIDKGTLWYLLVFMDSYSFDDLKSLMALVFGKFKNTKKLDMRIIQLLACIYVSYMKYCRAVGSKREFNRAATHLRALPDLPIVFLSKMIGRYLVAIKEGDDKLAKELKNYIEIYGYEKYLHA